MPVTSPVSDRLTVVSLLLLTFATGIVDAVSVLALGHVFVANMTGNIIFLGFWFVPHSGVDLTAAIVAFVSFLAGTVLGGRLARHIGSDARRWLTAALGVEVVVLLTLSIPAGTGVLNYHDNTKLILIAGLAMTSGSQHATARQFGIQELSTTVLTSTVVALGFDSRLAGGTGHREKLRYSVVVTMCGGAVAGATITRFAVAPAIALAAAVVAVQRRDLPVRPASAAHHGRLVSQYAISTGHRRGRGIGKSIVKHLAATGWDVIAGVRSESDAGEVTEVNPQRVSSVILDVTDAGQIAALKDSLPERLDAIINNAGIVVTGPVESVTPEKWRTQLEVNVIGQLAVTQAVLGRLRKSREEWCSSPASTVESRCP